MKVYVLTKGHFNATSVIGVYASLEAAQAAKPTKLWREASGIDYEGRQGRVWVGEPREAPSDGWSRVVSFEVEEFELRTAPPQRRRHTEKIMVDVARGWLNVNGYAGLRSREVEIVSEMPRRLRIRALIRTALAGRARHLEPGEEATVPRTAVTAEPLGEVVV
jgi:hypothetical protein